MDTGQILSIFLRGALGIRGRKRARRAARFVTGHRGFLSASTLLGAAGVAWGIYDSMKEGATGATGATGASGAMGATGATGASGLPAIAQPGSASATAGATGGLTMPPPLPGTATSSDAVLPMDVVRLVRLAVSAARADGTLTPQERELVVEHARQAGIESLVEQELARARPLAEIVGGVSDSQAKHDLYVLAFTIIRADESVTGAERVYLAQLAHQLGLDADTAGRLERETAAGIDSIPDADTPP
jgi:uncharacterized membrane protein YebE (DUF533 family)